MATNGPVPVAHHLTRFMHGCEVCFWAGKISQNGHALQSLMEKIADNRSLIAELPLTDAEKAQVRAYSSSPAGGGNPYGYQGLSQQQVSANAQAQQVIITHAAEIQTFGKQLAVDSARPLRGKVEFSHAFRREYNAGFLDDEVMRGAVIRAGQPDVDVPAVPGGQTARDRAYALGHHNVIVIPPLPPPSSGTAAPRHGRSPSPP